MKYIPPLGSADPDATYVDPVTGTIPAAAVEQPMREIAGVITGMGLVPSENDLTQLDQAIDLKVAAVQPDLSEFVSRGELISYKKELADYVKRLVVSEKYDLCEFYYFRSPLLRPGFLPANGDLLENAADLYPEAWAYVQAPEGQALCVAEEEWQAMSRAVWATLADGTQVGWNGTGGVPFFAPDVETGALRLPDLRGMYAEAAGFDALRVGDVHGDGIREIAGGLDSHFFPFPSITAFYAAGGAFYENGTTPATGHVADTASKSVDFHRITGFSARRVVPTANKNQPRAWGALACVYLGTPAA